MEIIKVIKYDRLIGGESYENSILPEGFDNISFSSGQSEITLGASVEVGFHTIEIDKATIPEGQEIDILYGNKVLYTVYPSNNVQFKTVYIDANETDTINMKRSSSTGTVKLEGTRIYPGENLHAQVNLVPIKLEETKKVNLEGWYVDVELKLEHADDIKKDYIILVNTKSKGEQPFRIGDVEKTKRRLIFTADHIFWDLETYVTPGFHVEQMGIANVLNKLMSSTDRKHPFKHNTTVEATNTFTFPSQDVLKSMHDILENWGGKLDIDWYNFTLREEMGEDRGETITYGKNLEDIKVTERWDGVVTKLLPIGPDGYKLPEVYIESPVRYNRVYAKVVSFDLSDNLKGEDIPEEAKQDDLRQKAILYVEKNQYPKLSYQVTSNINQDLEIWDHLEVKHPAISEVLPLDGDVSETVLASLGVPIRVLAYKYDVLARRVTSIEYGNYSNTLKSILSEREKELKDEVDAIFIDQEGKLDEQREFLENLNKNGHLIIENDMLYVVDTLPKEDAKYVLKLGLGGIAFSETGMDGDYTSAWTLDGQFSADFITSGTLEGSLLRVESIEAEHLSLNAKSFIMEMVRQGGTNLIKNSVGFKGVVLPWKSVGTVTSGVTTWNTQHVAKHGWIFPQPNSNIEQTVVVPEGELLTLSFNALKEEQLGTLRVIATYHTSEEGKSNNVLWEVPDRQVYDGKVIMTIPARAGNNQITVKILAIGTSTVRVPQVDDVMLSRGRGDFWQQADGELYTTDVLVDENGIKVIRRDKETGQEIGHTEMTPFDFSGWYNGERVFTLNDDITEVSGINVKGKGVYVRPVKMVQNFKGNGSLDIVWTGKG